MGRAYGEWSRGYATPHRRERSIAIAGAMPQRRTNRRQVPRAQVYGAGVFAERFDWPAVTETHDRLAQVLDANLSTVAQAEAHADAVLATPRSSRSPARSRYA